MTIKCPLQDISHHRAKVVGEMPSLVSNSLN
jgi:hypothetical protein